MTILRFYNSELRDELIDKTYNCVVVEHEMVYEVGVMYFAWLFNINWS